MQTKHLVLAAAVAIAAFIIYAQFYMAPADEGVGFTGHILSSPAESAATLTGLIILSVLVWFTVKDMK